MILKDDFYSLRQATGKQCPVIPILKIVAKYDFQTE